MSENIVEGSGGKIHRLKEAAIEKWPFSKEHKFKERGDRLERWVNQGLDLLRGQRFQDAVDFFENREMAERLGISWGGVYDMPLRVTSPEEFGENIGYCASKSKFTTGFGDSGSIYNAREKYWPVSIHFGRIIALDPDPNAGIPDSVHQDMALVHAEEWLHALQYFRGKPLTGRIYSDLPGESAQEEIDIAAYLLDHRVELTPKFLARYARSDVLTKAGYPV